MRGQLYVSRSPIHGLGLFTRAPLTKGMLLGRYRGRPARRDGTYVLWVPKRRGWVAISGRNKFRYMNHSSRPNVELYADEIWTLRSIRPHEELTFHYGDEWLDVR